MVDTDLLSIQEARTLVRSAKAALAELAKLDQAGIDRLVEAICIEASHQAERLARMAVKETGFGRWQDKKQKNLLASENVWAHI